ncbi:MAG: AEC family transporter [Alphaproteobacteria bacterium]
MEQFLNLILPFFVVILLGYTAGLLKWMPASALPNLIRFVMLFLLPPMLFELLANTPFQKIANVEFFVLYGLSSLTVFATTYILLKLVFKNTTLNAAYFAQGCAMPNTGYLGLPMLTGILGPFAAVAVTICLIVELLVVAPLTLFMATESNSEQSRLQAYKALAQTVLKAIFTNPLIIATMVAITASYFQFKLPGFAQATVSILAKGATPIALFSIGLALSQRSFSESSGEVWLMTIMRLAIHPLIIWVLVFHLFPQDRIFAVTAVLVSALPMAANAYLLGERGGANVQTISAAILVTSVISVASFTTILWMIQ